MKSICILLLMGISTYVQGEGHDCDPFAMNVKTKTPVQRTGHDANNQELDLSVILGKSKHAFEVTHASPTTVPGSNEICTGPTHGNDCGGVEYAYILDGDYQADRADMFKGIQFKTTLIGFDKDAQRGMELTMTIAGANKDDYIFEWVEGTDITAHILLEASPGKKFDYNNISAEILAILKRPFALYSMQVGGYALWVTCDGLYAWVTYPHNTVAPHQDRALMIAIESLTEVTQSYKNVKPNVAPIDPEMPEQFSNMITALQ